MDFFSIYQGSPNLIRNGDFEVAQRGTSIAYIAGGSGYSLDGFRCYNNTDGAVTITQDTSVPPLSAAGCTSKHSLKLQVDTSDSSIGSAQFLIVDQKIEGYDIYPTVGKTITLSFWVKAKKTGIYCCAIKNSGADRTFVREYTISVADTWEKKIVSFTMDFSGGTWDYTNGIGLFMQFVIACGSNYQTTKDAWQSGNYIATSSQVNALDSTNNYLSLAQVKLEVGVVPTPFVPPLYSQELARCQRYLRVIRADTQNADFLSLFSATGTTAWKTFEFSPPMRAAPSTVSTIGTISQVVIGSAGGFAVNAAYMNASGGLVIFGGTTTTGSPYVRVYDEAASPNSGVLFSSEL